MKENNCRYQEFECSCTLHTRRGLQFDIAILRRHAFVLDLLTIFTQSGNVKISFINSQANFNTQRLCQLYFFY